MVDRIQDHIFDILAADSRLVTGGFDGVRRVYDGDVPASGFINMFDGALEDDSKEARPGIYFGLRNYQATDRPESRTVSSMGLFQHRIVTVPIVVVCTRASRSEAKEQRNQIVANITAILTDYENVLQESYWFLLVQGNTQSSFRNSGGGIVGAVEARAVMNWDASYKYRAGTVVA